jgi:hypothetical protein
MTVGMEMGRTPVKGERDLKDVIRTTTMTTTTATVRQGSNNTNVNKSNCNCIPNNSNPLHTNNNSFPLEQRPIEPIAFTTR